MSDVLECPCCGNVAAESDVGGLFYDGQSTICGCGGQVMCDSEEEAYVSVDECAGSHDEQDDAHRDAAREMRTR